MESDEDLIKVQRWDEVACGPMSEAAIRALYTPPERFRISPSHYPPNTKFRGSMMSGQIYVLRGSCGYLFDGHDPIVLSAGDTVRFPEGDFDMFVLGNEEVYSVLVWELPLGFNRSG